MKKRHGMGILGIKVLAGKIDFSYNSDHYSHIHSSQLEGGTGVMHIKARPLKRFGGVAAAVSLLTLLALTGCGSGGGGNYNPPPQQPQEEPQPELTDIIIDATEQLRCIVEDDPLADCDGDGIWNVADVVPTRDDMADDDRDGVINKRDRWEGVDDTTLDTDGDGTADWLDTFFGDNYGDEDRDGLPNGIDAQPYSAPPTGVATQPSTSYSYDDVTNSLLDLQSRRTYLEVYSPSADRDHDGWTDNVDTTPTGSTNDYDNDGTADWYDPYPTDSFINAYNDPWDPSNDEYWED